MGVGLDYLVSGLPVGIFAALEADGVWCKGASVAFDEPQLEFSLNFCVWEKSANSLSSMIGSA